MDCLYTRRTTNNPTMKVPSRAKTTSHFCRGKCDTYDIKRKRGVSIYEKCCKCHNCEAYIPRDLLIKFEGETKPRCPCCEKSWLKGAYKTITGIQVHLELERKKRLEKLPETT